MLSASQTKIDRPPLMMTEYTFDKWVLEKRTAQGLTQDALAKKADTTKQTISSIERRAKHPISEAPYRPTEEMVDSIAQALNESVTDARLAAGYLPVNFETDYNPEEARLIRYFSEIPRECQLDVLALTEALWRRRRVKRPVKDSVREVPKPQEIPKKDRRAREKRGLKQGWVADRLGVSRQSLWLYETKKMHLSPEAVEKICETFQCDLSELVEMRDISSAVDTLKRVGRLYGVELQAA